MSTSSSTQKPRPQSRVHNPLRQKQPQGNKDAFRKHTKRPALSTGESLYPAGGEPSRFPSLHVCQSRQEARRPPFLPLRPHTGRLSQQGLPEPPSCPTLVIHRPAQEPLKPSSGNRQDLTPSTLRLGKAGVPRLRAGVGCGVWGTLSPGQTMGRWGKVGWGPRFVRYLWGLQILLEAGPDSSAAPPGPPARPPVLLGEAPSHLCLRELVAEQVPGALALLLLWAWGWGPSAHPGAWASWRGASGYSRGPSPCPDRPCDCSSS